MTIPIEIIVAILAPCFVFLVTLQVWIIRQIFKLERRLGDLLIILEDHFKIRIPSGDTEHLRRSFLKRSTL